MEQLICYVVAIYNNFTARLDILYIHQRNEIEAVKAALLHNTINNTHYEDREQIIKETREWLDSMPENLDEIMEILINAEYVVTCSKNINQ